MVAHGDIRRPVDALPPVSFSVSAWTQRQAAHVSAGGQRAVQSTTSICMQPAAHRVCVHFCGFHSKPDFHPLLTGLPISTLVANITARTGAAAHATPPARTSPLGRAALVGYLCRSVRARAGGGADTPAAQRSAAQQRAGKRATDRGEPFDARSFTQSTQSSPANLGTAVVLTRKRERAPRPGCPDRARGALQREPALIVDPSRETRRSQSHSPRAGPCNASCLDPRDEALTVPQSCRI